MIGIGNVEGPSIRWLAPFMMNRTPSPMAQNFPMMSFSGPRWYSTLRLANGVVRENVIHVISHYSESGGMNHPTVFHPTVLVGVEVGAKTSRNRYRRAVTLAQLRA